jgi:hypothetical protein
LWQWQSTKPAVRVFHQQVNKYCRGVEFGDKQACCCPYIEFPQIAETPVADADEKKTTELFCHPRFCNTTNTRDDDVNESV